MRTRWKMGGEGAGWRVAEVFGEAGGLVVVFPRWNVPPLTGLVLLLYAPCHGVPQQPSWSCRFPIQFVRFWGCPRDKEKQSGIGIILSGLEDRSWDEKEGLGRRPTTDSSIYICKRDTQFEHNEYRGSYSKSIWCYRKRELLQE